MIGSNNIIKWQHYLAFVFIIVNGILFFKQHQLGVLYLGLTLFLSLFGVLSFNVGLLSSSIYWTPFDLKIPIFIGNPIILIWIVLHFILSGRFYIGILTKKYWDNLLDKK